MARKVILDVDPGIDDAMALCLALSNPELDVVAVTAVGGNVAPAQATRNVQAIIEQLDPPRWPRLGAASEPDNRLAVDRRNLYGSDGLGGASFVVAERQHLLPSEKVICDQVRDAPHAVTIVALGPLTNIARAFIRDPELPALVGRIVIMGGTVAGPGNITPAAEFNMYCDPVSAQAVFRSPSTKTLVPLDVTNRIELSYDLFNQLPDESTRVGRLLRQIAAAGLPRLPPAVRSGGDSRSRHGDADGRDPSRIVHHQADGRRRGDARRVDRRRDGFRPPPRARLAHNMEVAVDMQKDAVIEAILRGLTGR